MNLSLDNILNLLEYTLLYAAIFSLVALGGMFSERSGVINIALEGIMVIGAVIGAVVLAFLQRTPNPDTMGEGLVNFLTFVQGKGKFLMVIFSLIGAAVGGAIYSLLLAFASINLKADQTIGGTSLNLLATAIALVIARLTSILKSYSFPVAFPTTSSYVLCSIKPIAIKVSKSSCLYDLQRIDKIDLK